MRSVFVRLSRYAEAASSKFGCLLSGSFAVSVPVLEQGLLVEADLGLYCGVWVLHCVVRLLLLLQRVLRVGDGLPGWEGKRRGVVAMLHSAFGEHVGSAFDAARDGYGVSGLWRRGGRFGLHYL